MPDGTNEENDRTGDSRIRTVRRSEYNAWMTWEGEGGSSLDLGDLRIVEDDEFAYWQTSA
jgi:hypothetical protein